MGKKLTFVFALFIFAGLLFAQGPYYKPYIWKANEPITVDGVLDEWNYNFHWDHNQGSMPETARCHAWLPDDNVDKSGYLMLMWDENYLYFAGNVMDDVPAVIPAPGWRADCFEIYIGNWDIGPNKPWPDYVNGTSKMWPDEDDGKWACQFSLQWDAEEDTAAIINFELGAVDVETEETTLVGKLWDNEEGYVIEGKIKWSEQESPKGNVFELKEGMHIPIATTLYDVDDYVDYDFDGYSASSGDHNPPSGIGPGYQSTEIRGVRPDGAFMMSCEPYIQKAPGVVTLDGNFDDWAYAFNLDYNQTAFTETARCRGFWPLDNEDLSGRHMFMWDEEYLYFAAEIKDDVPGVVVGAGSDGWRNDVMELYIGNFDQGEFDVTPHPETGGYTADIYDELEMQLSITWDSDQDTVRIWNWTPLNRSLATENSTLFGKLWDRGEGYILEGKLNLAEIAAFDENGRTFNFTELLGGIIPFNASCWDVDDWDAYDFDGYIEDVSGAYGGPASGEGANWHGAKIVGKSIFAELDWLWENYVDVETKQPAVPGSFALHQNFPNPFNPTTTITFDLARNGDLSLGIYNSRGELVRNIINHEYRTMGAYSINVDMSDLPSGLYLSVLEQENVRQSGKMMLLK